MPHDPEPPEPADPEKLGEKTKESFEKIRKMVQDHNKTLPEGEEPPLFRPRD
jgi:hypothetical protein